MIKNNRGFSLVELLVVTVIMGLVVAAVYTLYVSTQRTAFTSDEVVDVQQNLRFALDQIANDIRLAGFLIPSGANPLVNTPNSLLDGNLTISTSMTTRRVARIVGNYGVDADTFVVTSPEMYDYFNVGDAFFIVRPSTDPRLIVNGNIASGGQRSPPTLVINTPTPEAVFDGDMIIPAFNNQITYSLVADPNGGNNVNILRRSVTATPPADVAGKISDVAFEYIQTDGVTTAVRVRVEGQTDETMTGQDNYSGVKTRSYETVVRLRNR